MRHTLFSLLAVIGVLAALVAGLVVWLLLQEPVAVADAVSSGRFEPLLASLTTEVAGWMRALARLL